MALKYTNTNQFFRRYGLLASVLNYLPNQDPERETVAATVVAETTYYLAQMGVLGSTLKLYVGDTSTLLTLTTDYSFDEDTGAVAITAAGVTALAGEPLTAVYDFSILGKFFRQSDAEEILEDAEAELQDDTDMVFTTLAIADYKQLVDEETLFTLKNGAPKSNISINFPPFMNLDTTTNGAFTLGGTNLTLTDATGFPSTGTIYVGGNKVAYTANAANVLTVPNTTPSIDDGATVRGEVFEVSLQSDGNLPTWQVLEYNTEYEPRGSKGVFSLLSTAFFNQVSVSNIRLFPERVRMRCSYMQAWRDGEQDPVIPTKAVNAIYMIAARMLAKRNIRRSQVNGIDYDPSALNVDETQIEKVKNNFMLSKMTIN